MGRIIFVEHNDQEHSVDIEEGKTLMQIAMDNGVPGIDADCGGECCCGTCHVVVDSEWFSRLAEVSDEEEQMIGMTPEKSDTSRLSCQIPVNEDMDGMTVRLPEFQM